MKLFQLILFTLLISCSQLPKKRTDKLSIVQGITNSKEVEFSIVALSHQNLRFELRSQEGEVLEPIDVKSITKDFSNYTIHKILFTRAPLDDYNLYVYQNDKIIDQRLVGKGQKESSRLRLVVASCLDDFYPDFKIWNEVAKKNPEYLLLIGDNVYADRASSTSTQVTDPEVLWKRYIDLRLSLPLYFQEKLIPIHALWDDHDYGFNNGNEDYHHKKTSKEIFEAFWAQDLSNDDWVKSFGVGGLLTLGNFNLYFLDGRYHRSSNGDESHLGLEQTAWFYSKLRDERAPSIIIKGDQFFGGYHKFESFEGNHAKDFQNYTSELKKIDTPFVFLSGDRHMSEIMHFPRSIFGKPSFEITSSPIHGNTYPVLSDNPWRVVSEIERPNFILIDNLAQENHWFLDVESIGENGEVYFKRELAVYIKDLQNNLNEVRKRRYLKRRYKRARPQRSRRR